MDNRYYENVITEMKPFLDENSFKSCEDGSFANDKKSVKIGYDEARQMYIMNIADIEEGKIGEYVEVNAWFFDDSQNAKDAVSVGIDFVNSLRKNLGIKVKRVASAGEIDLPTAAKNGSMTVTGFTKKMLDVYPELKEQYKNHIADYGNFLYLNFFGEYLVPQLVNTFRSGTKKQIKKLFEVFEDVYVKGDREAVNAAVAVLCAAAYNNEKVYSKVIEAIGDDAHFKSSFESFSLIFGKNKKLVEALVRKTT